MKTHSSAILSSLLKHRLILFFSQALSLPETSRSRWNELEMIHTEWTQADREGTTEGAVTHHVLLGVGMWTCLGKIQSRGAQARLLCGPGSYAALEPLVLGLESPRPSCLLASPEPGSEHRHSEMSINQGNHRGPAAWWGWICFQVGGEENSMVGNCFQDREEFCFSCSKRPGREESTGKDGRGMAISMRVPHLSPKRWQLLNVSSCLLCSLRRWCGGQGRNPGLPGTVLYLTTCQDHLRTSLGKCVIPGPRFPGLNSLGCKLTMGI